MNIFNIDEYVNNCVNGIIENSWRKMNIVSMRKHIDRNILLDILEKINEKYIDINDRICVKEKFLEHILTILYGLNCCICCRESTHSRYLNKMYDYSRHNPICQIKFTDFLDIVHNEYDNGEINEIVVGDTLSFLVNVLRCLENTNVDVENTVISLITRFILDKNVFTYLNLSFNGFIVLWIHMFQHQKIHGLQLLDIYNGKFGLNATIFFETMKYMFTSKHYSIVDVDNIIETSIDMIKKYPDRLNTKYIDYTIKLTPRHPDYHNFLKQYAANK